jgi:hypothetical protein
VYFLGAAGGAGIVAEASTDRGNEKPPECIAPGLEAPRTRETAEGGARRRVRLSVGERVIGDSTGRLEERSEVLVTSGCLEGKIGAGT